MGNETFYWDGHVYEPTRVKPENQADAIGKVTCGQNVDFDKYL